MEHRFIISGFADEATPGLDGQIALLGKLGVGYIEPRNVNGKNIVDLSDAEIKEMKRKLDAAGIKVSSIGSPIGKIGIDAPLAPELTRLDRALTAAEILDAPYVRMFSFFVADEEAVSCRSRVHEGIGQFLRAAEGRGARLAHENEKGIYGSNTARTLDLMRTFARDGLNCVFDPANFLQCSVHPEEAFDALSEYVNYFHIKDAYFGKPEVVPAGHGDGHIREILSSLNDKQMFLSIEPHLSVSPWMENIMAQENIRRTDGNLSDAEALWTVAHRALVNLLAE